MKLPVTILYCTMIGTCLFFLLSSPLKPAFFIASAAAMASGIYLRIHAKRKTEKPVTGSETSHENCPDIKIQARVCLNLAKGDITQSRQLRAELDILKDYIKKNIRQKKSMTQRPDMELLAEKEIIASLPTIERHCSRAISALTDNNYEEIKNALLFIDKAVDIKQK